MQQELNTYVLEEVMDVLGCKHMAQRGVFGWGADRSGESTAHTLNSKLLLVKGQGRDPDPTPFHPCFPLLLPLLPLVLVEWTMDRCPSC